MVFKAPFPSAGMSSASPANDLEIYMLSAKGIGSSTANIVKLAELTLGPTSTASLDMTCLIASVMPKSKYTSFEAWKAL